MPIQRKAAFISLLVSVLVLALKAYAYYQTHSAGILSDALETTINVVTAVVAFFVIQFAMAPADKEHPYGHGKIEYFSAAFEGGVIFFAALAIIFESAKSFFHPHKIHNVSEGIGFIVVATMINFVVGLYLLKVGKQSKSETLKASGTHLLSDVKTTIGVIVGLALYKLTGHAWIDSSVGMIVGAWLLYESFRIIKSNVGGLLDELDIECVKELCFKMSKHLEPAIINIHNLRIIRSGHFHHMDAHLVIPEYYDIKHVHEIIHRFEASVIKDYSYEGEFVFHTDPCGSHYCSVCMVENCPIRKNPFVKRPLLDYRNVISGPKHTD